MTRDIPKATYLQDYRPPTYLVEQVELSFNLEPQDTIVEANLFVRRNHVNGDEQVAFHLDGEEMELLSLSIDGKKLSNDEYSLD